MAKTDEITLDSAQEELYLKALRVQNRYYDPIVCRKDIIWRKRNNKLLEAQSQVNPIADLWNALTDAEREAWNSAGAHCAMIGYQLFVQDTSYRISHELEGLAVPNLNHQFKVLDFVTGVNSTEWVFYYYNPLDYWIKQKNVGQKNAYTPIHIVEVVHSPILVEFDYFSDMVWDDTPDYYGFLISVSGIKSGVPAYRYHWVDLNLEQDWVKFSYLFSFDLDVITHYECSFNGYPIIGRLMIDNFNINHSGQNWAFDPKCDNIGNEIVDVGDGFFYPWLLSYSYDLDFFGSAYLDE